MTRGDNERGKSLRPASIYRQISNVISLTPEERKEIDKLVRLSYGVRSDIVHGRKSSIVGQDLVEFANLVRDISWAVLNKLDEFSSVDDLQRWVLTQRYQ